MGRRWAHRAVHSPGALPYVLTRATPTTYQIWESYNLLQFVIVYTTGNTDYSYRKYTTVVVMFISFMTLTTLARPYSCSLYSSSIADTIYSTTGTDVACKVHPRSQRLARAVADRGRIGGSKPARPAPPAPNPPSLSASPLSSGAVAFCLRLRTGGDGHLGESVPR